MYIALSIAMIVGSGLLLLKFANYKLEINYISYSYTIFLTVGYVGSLLMALGLQTDGYFASQINADLADEALLITSYAISVYVFVICFLLYCTPGLLKRFKNYNQAPIRLNYSRSGECVLYVLWAVCSIYYLVSIHPSPIYMMLNNSAPLEIALRRNEITEHYHGVGLLKTLAVNLSYPVLLLAIVRLNFKKNIMRILGIFLLCCLIICANGEKGPLVNLIISVLILCVYIGYKPKSLHLFAFLLTVIFCIFILYCVFFDYDDFAVLIDIIIERLFIAQTVATNLVLDFYNNNNLIYFDSFESGVLKSIFNSNSQRSGEVIMNYYYPGMREMGSWNVNGIFVHEAYSNFGYLGVIVSPIYAGLFNFLLLSFFLFISKTPLNVSFFAYLTVNTVSLVTSFNQILFNTNVILTLIVVLSLNLLNKRNG